METYRRFVSAVKKLRRGQRDWIICTIRGRLNARAVCRPAPQGPKTGPVLIGYGPGSDFPAELTFWEIEDVAVEKRWPENLVSAT